VRRVKQHALHQHSLRRFRGADRAESDQARNNSLPAIPAPASALRVPAQICAATTGEQDPRTQARTTSNRGRGSTEEGNGKSNYMVLCVTGSRAKGAARLTSEFGRHRRQKCATGA